MANAKKHISQIPVIGDLAGKLYLYLKKKSFDNSATYWEQRYAAGHNSGGGSYNALASFKADLLNDFVKSNNIDTIIEFGCGDGNQLLLANYPKYTGLDISNSAISLCKSKFKNDLSKTFNVYNSSDCNDKHPTTKAKLALSLDVIYHLVEDKVFYLYLEHLFKSASHYVIIYSTDDDTPYPHQLPHVKHRNFSTYVSNSFNDWCLADRVPNKFPLAKFPESGSDAEFFIYKRR